MKRKDWQKLIDENPEDWVLRLAFADWLVDEGKDTLAMAQRWIGGNQKCVGPPCVIRGSWSDVTWFNEIVADTSWAFPVDSKDARWVQHGGFIYNVDPRWCLPTKIFHKLDGHNRYNHTRVDHNSYAKSYRDRQRAEWALGMVLLGKEQDHES